MDRSVQIQPYEFIERLLSSGTQTFEQISLWNDRHLPSESNVLIGRESTHLLYSAPVSPPPNIGWMVAPIFLLWVFPDAHVEF